MRMKKGEKSAPMASGSASVVILNEVPQWKGGAERS
jgi:hypothetical protein